MSFFQQLPTSVLQAGAIFLSIMIEALPFVLIGSLISGAIDVYITPEKVYRALPKNKWGRILFGTLIGFIFPSCECGIVPIINRFLEKKVPSYTAVPFLVTAPVINPIVLFCYLFCLWEFHSNGSPTGHRIDPGGNCSGDFPRIFPNSFYPTGQP